VIDFSKRGVVEGRLKKIRPVERRNGCAVAMAARAGYVFYRFGGPKNNQLKT